MTARSLRVEGPYRVRFDSPGIGSSVNVAAGDGYVIPDLTFDTGDVVYNAWVNVVVPFTTGDASSLEAQAYYGRSDPNDNLLGGTGATVYAQGLSASTAGLLGVTLTRKPPVGSGIAHVAGGAAAALPRTVATAGEPVIVTLASNGGAGGNPITAGELDLFFLVAKASAPFVAGWPDLARLKRALGVTIDNTERDADMLNVLAAAIDRVTIDVGEPIVSPTPAQAEAALLLAVSVTKAKDAPHGVAAIFDTGGIYVAAQHPTYVGLLKGSRVAWGIA